jgi:hypothetical protein
MKRKGGQIPNEYNFMRISRRATSSSVSVLQKTANESAKHGG